MVIIDASVANKLFLSNEEYHKEAKELIGKHIAGIEGVTVPDLLFYEVANTLATKTVIPQRQVVRSITKLYKLKLNVYHPVEVEVKAAARLAKQQRISVYDAIYAILAKRKRCKLITADERFVKQVNLRSVKSLSSLK